MKATENKLGELHAVVATVLASQLSHQEEGTDFNDEGEMVPNGEMQYSASPAVIAAAIKFLKDNDITADAEQDENLSNLRDVLAKKQKHSRVSGAAAANVVSME